MLFKGILMLIIVNIDFIRRVIETVKVIVVNINIILENFVIIEWMIPQIIVLL